MKKILVAHREEPGEYRQKLHNAGIELPEEGIVEATNVTEIRQALETEDIEVMVATSTEKLPFELTKIFMKKIEPYATHPELYEHPQVLVINTGHYQSRHEARQIVEDNFPIPKDKAIFAENMSEAMEIMSTEPVDMVVAVTATEKLRQETKFVLSKLAELRGADDISAHGITLDRVSRMVTIEDRAIKLSKIEAKLLETFLSRPDSPLGSEYLLSEVWGDDDPDNTYLVRTAIKRLRNKIEPDPSNPTYIVTWGSSYKLSNNSSS